MNVHISYKLHKTPAIEKEMSTLVAKLGRRLRVFRPGLVHLKGIVEPSSARDGASVSLNLRLPSGQMAAQESAPRAATAIKAAFEELLQQLNKHKGRLRNTKKWPRWRRGGEGMALVPFEDTLAAVSVPLVSPDDVRAYVDANLMRFRAFVEQEIAAQESADRIAPELVTGEEVIDEVIAMALEDGISKPERIGLESWLRRLALRAIQTLAARRLEEESDIHLEESVRRRNVRGSDEPELQFHQPDETFTKETVIADRRVSTPEDIAYSDELLSLLHSHLTGVTAHDREAFILHVIEGFTVDEVAAVMNQPASEVVSSIAAAREHLLNFSLSKKPSRAVS
jgi:RNA polymerase sigma factor (sigma-70 family)